MVNRNIWNAMNKIVCKWREDKRCLVNPDGQVFQCCYYKMHDHRKNSFLKDEGHSVTIEYQKNYAKYNLKNASLKSILDSTWFSKTLPESWSNPDTAPYACQKNCKVTI